MALGGRASTLWRTGQRVVGYRFSLNGTQNFLTRYYTRIERESQPSPLLAFVEIAAFARTQDRSSVAELCAYQ
jgi:hypothetical protein